MGEPLKVQVARLEERLVGLDAKVDQHNEASAASHAALSAEFRSLSEHLKHTLDKIESHGSQIQDLKRDRTWVVGIFGLMWAAAIAYFNKYRAM